MKDEGHGFYPLIGYFCHVRSMGLLVWMLVLSPRGHLHCDVKARERARGLCTFKVRFLGLIL